MSQIKSFITYSLQKKIIIRIRVIWYPINHVNRERPVCDKIILTSQCILFLEISLRASKGAIVSASEVALTLL